MSSVVSGVCRVGITFEARIFTHEAPRTMSAVLLLTSQVLRLRAIPRGKPTTLTSGGKYLNL